MRAGVGSLFVHRKHSLILSDAIGATWVGQISNAHDKPQPGKYRTRNCARFFGLGSEECDSVDLLRAQGRPDNFLDPCIHCHNRSVRMHPPPKFAHDFDNSSRLVFSTSQLVFVSAKSLFLMVNPRRMCAQVIESPGKAVALYRQLFNITQNTVVVVRQEDHATSKKKRGDNHDDLNYCTFNKRFRDRFHAVQLGTRLGLLHSRPPSEFWVSVHYRWGDFVHPQHKNGASLQQIAKAVAAHLVTLSHRLSEQQKLRVFFMSEGPAREFTIFQETVPNAEMYLNEPWQNSLRRLANSNILVGGGSAFFVLGAFLNDDCTILETRSRPTANHFRVIEGYESIACRHRIAIYDAPLPVRETRQACGQQNVSLSQPAVRHVNLFGINQVHPARGLRDGNKNQEIEKNKTIK